MIRTITVASTQRSGAKELRSEATTWGQLKDALRNDFSDLDKMRAVVRETRVDLASDEAMLPEESFTILLTPKQIKAGSRDVDVIAVLEDVKQKFSDSIDEIIAGIEEGEYDKVASNVEKVTKPISNDLQKELEALKAGHF